MPLPTVDDLLSDLGGANVFSTMDSVSGFFLCSVHEDSIPLTAVCTQAGNYEWTVMPMGFPSSPGWFQSIRLRVCDGLHRVRLFIDDKYVFRRTGENMCVTRRKNSIDLRQLNLKLAPNKFRCTRHQFLGHRLTCLLYTSPSPRDATLSRMPSSA